MPLGAIAGGAASGLASAGVGALTSGGGSTDPGSGGVIPSFNFGGLSGFVEQNPAAGQPGAGIFSSTARGDLVQGVRLGFLGQEGALSGLRSQVQPGFGRLSEARRGIFAEQRQRLENARKRAVGDLRENLARRRVSGSSFAADTISRREAEFAQEERALSAQEAEAAAVSFLEELELTNNLINQEFEARRNNFQTAIDELNLQTDVGLQLITGAQSQLGANARLRAELSAQEAQGRGRFFGQASQPFTSAIGQGVQSLFSGSGSGGNLSGSTVFTSPLSGQPSFSFT